ncbi:MAG: hypothetical protein CMJ94_15160 [Planctomycetes bacterium]|nr:hypothetical protein [Planctomycetota bacterium]
MITLFSLILLAAAPAPQETVAPADPEAVRTQIVASVTAEELQAHVDFLAGPETRGRATLTPGFDKAAEYVEQHLKDWGLEPAGEEGGYRLPVGLRCVVPSPEAFVEIHRKKDDIKQLRLGLDFVPVPGGGVERVQGEPVFVGFAIDGRKEKWQDLSKVKGKIVFAFTREPYADNPKDKRFAGLEATEHSEIGRKAREVANAGGIALVVVPDPGMFPDEVGPVPNLVPQPLYPGTPVRALRRIANIPDIPVMSLSRKAASEIFEEDLDDYYESILKRKRPKQLKAARGLEIALRPSVEEGVIPSYNLAAWVRGTDGDGEAVVIGAHLDHVGLNDWADGGKMRVHPGADDNASGSAALLEIAQALSETKPREDILLLWFTGEENGLLGSRAYCEKPLVAHEQTLIMLNMDQIARTDPKSMNLGGLWDAPDLEKLSKRIAKNIDQELKLDFEGGRELFARSDHYSFFQKGVPVIFFFEGDIDSNPVYHKPGDVPAGIHADKVMWVARQVLATAWAYAGEGQRP